MVSTKPQSLAEYDNAQAQLVRATCLYVATKLGDLMDDLMGVGGLVPSLIVDQLSLPDGVDAHVGTMDLDVGLQVALLDNERYRTLTQRLRDAGLAMDTNEAGNPTRQRWAIDGPGRVVVDFLIPPAGPDDVAGRLRHIEPDFAAIVSPGLRCAFRDRQSVTLRGETPRGEAAVREVPVCGPGGFLVLKALAFDGRGENKDAYDLFYVVRNHGDGPATVAERIAPLLDDPQAQQALAIVRRDFSDTRALGPRRVAEFITGEVDERIQADVVGFVAQLLHALPAQ